jgi:hypothetical protein
MSKKQPKDKVSLIRKNGGVVGFKINDKDFFAEMTGNVGCVVVELNNLKGFRIGSIPEGFFLKLVEHNIIDFEGQSSYRPAGKQAFGQANVEFIIWKDSWEGKFGAKEYLNGMKKAIEMREKSDNDVFFFNISDFNDHLSCEFCIVFLENLPIDQAYHRVGQIVQELEGHAESSRRSRNFKRCSQR